MLTYLDWMPKSSIGRLGVVLCLACALVSACSSRSSGNLNGASGSAGATAGASSHAGTGSAGSTSSSGGTAGKVIIGSGGATDGGAQNSDSGASGEAGASDEAGASGEAGGAENVFVDQVVFTQDGGPPRCLPRPLPVGPPGTANDGRVACWIAELKPGSCDCSQTARAPLRASLLTTTRRQLQLTGGCGGDSGVSCDTFCGCEIDQTPGVASDHGAELYACQNDLIVAANVDGFCVIDQGRTDASSAPAPLGNPTLVAECPANEKRLLRFVGAGQPASGATAFIGCTASPVN